MPARGGASRSRCQQESGASAVIRMLTSRGDGNQATDQPGSRRDSGALLSRARSRLRVAGRLHGDRRVRRTRGARQLRLRHATAQRDAWAPPLSATPQAHHAQRNGGAEVPLLHAHVHRPAVDPPQDGERERVLGALLPDADAVLPRRTPRSSRPRAARTTRATSGRGGGRRRSRRGAPARWRPIRRESTEAYSWLTGNEVARELARIDLPLSTYTQWYWEDRSTTTCCTS